MEFNYIKIKDFIYHFRDPQGVCFSIIQGSEKAIVVDTGYGIYDTKQIVEKFIKTPYIVINTHGHMDHTAGNFRFDEVFVPQDDYNLFLEHNNINRRMLNIEDAEERNLLPNDFDKEKYIYASLSNTKPIKVGTTIDLGNLHVELINMEGHTKGSIGLLIKEARILFTGDAAIHAIWMFLKESTDLSTYIKMLKRVKELPFDEFITGHLMDIYPKKYFDYYIEAAMNAKKENSMPVQYKGFERNNTYEYHQFFGDLRIAVCFQEPKEY